MARFFLFSLFLVVLLVEPAAAHFGMLIPSRSMVLTQKEAAVAAHVAFAHPFAATGMKMEKPGEVFLLDGTDRTPLALSDASWLGEQAYATEFQIRRPGVYQLCMSPRPYYEAAEQRFIIHYTKTVIGAFGYEDGYERAAGFPIEIIPLSRPFGNYAGNSFSGLVVYKGKPLAGADVEVEFLNEERKYRAPNPYFETQLVKTDASGVFTFSVPWPGWWGFAALTTGDEKIDHEGTAREVELGGVIWLEFYPAPAAE